MYFRVNQAPLRCSQIQ